MNTEPQNNTAPDLSNTVLANVLSSVDSLEFKYTQEIKSIVIKDIRFEIDIQDFLGGGENKMMGCIWQTVGTVRTHLVNIKYANSIEDLELKIESAIKQLLLKS